MEQPQQQRRQPPRRQVARRRRPAPAPSCPVLLLALPLSLLCLLAAHVTAFLPPSTTPLRPHQPQPHRARDMKRMVAVDDPTTLVGMTLDEYTGTLPDQAKGMKAEWQYLLVERMEAPTQTQGGLFLPSTDQDPLHMVRVVSIGSGLVGESGVLTQIPNLAAGDVAVVKQPWGIGPRDELWDGRKFSFIRSHDVLSRVGPTSSK